VNVLAADATASMTEELLEFLYLMPVGVLKFDGDGDVDLMNPAATSLLMPLTPDGTLGNFFQAMALVLPDLGRRVSQFTETAGIIVDRQRLQARAGGETLVLSLTVNRVNDRVYMAVLENVTKNALQERKIFDDREKFRAIFENVRDYAIYTITSSGMIEEWNHSLQRFSGWLPADVEGRSIAMFFPPDEADVPRVEVLLAEAERIGSVETEGWRLKSDGSRIWENTVITVLPDEVGAARGFTVVARDMTERKRLDDAMRVLTTVDPLTGAYNRRHGNALLAAESSRHQRDGQPFAALMLDVDHFKAINDRFGHPAGDAVLCALVQAAQSTLRAADVVARWGGEEFLLVLPGSDAAAAVLAAERVRAKLASTQVAFPGGEPINFTVSIGVAVPNSNDPEELLRRSDVALYAAKTGGRNRVVLAK
jgi:diguanylate cyclase (GGDEF)-like protein/PAS domain S-box-containing protein